uniref:Uncharacterized protein n=2 Tax=Triticum aestivum TaxID=4565 RepID=A0A077RS21_WHEAT|nr:unnamed protein product [Triticum aestivum]
MASEPYGHAISVVCVQPNMTESKFTCNMSYDCITTGCCGSASCHIRSSSLSDGLPTVHDLILPKGKVSDDAHGIMLRASIHHQSLSLGRSCFQGNGPTPALNQTPDTYHDGDRAEEDNIPLSLSRSRLRGKTPTPAVQRRLITYDDDDEDEDEDEWFARMMMRSMRVSDYRPLSLSRPQSICLDTVDEEDEIP